MKLLSVLPFFFLASESSAQKATDLAQSSTCKIEFDIRSIDYASEQRQWDNQKQQEVTLTKSNRFDIAMYTVTLAEGKKIMYTGEYGPHIQMGRCFTKDGKQVEGEHEWENHRKLGEAHDLSDEELASPEVKRTAAQFKHSGIMAKKQRKRQDFVAALSSRKLSQDQDGDGLPQCVVDAGCDMDILTNTQASSNPCADIQTLIDCVDDSSCDRDSKDSTLELLDPMEACYCDEKCDFDGGDQDGGDFDGGNQDGGDQDGGDQDGGDDGLPQCVVDAGCDMDILENPEASSNPCAAIETLMDCVDASSCDGDSKDNTFDQLDPMEACYCDKKCDFDGGDFDGGNQDGGDFDGGNQDGGDQDGGNQDGGDQDDGPDAAMCLMSCAGGKAPQTCSKAEEIEECIKIECSAEDLAASTAMVDMVKQCVCDENAQVCEQVGIEPIDTTALVDPFDYVNPHGGDLRHNTNWIMPAYEEDALSKFFQFHAFQSEHQHETPASDRYSPFSDFNVVHRKGAEEACVPMVKFNPNDKDFVEVTEVDGVDISCLMKYAAGFYQKKAGTDQFYQEQHMAEWWSGNEYLNVLRDLRFWMRRINGYAPPTVRDGMEPVTVKYIDPKSGQEKSRDGIYLTYKKWTMLDALIETRESKLHESQSKCSALPIATDWDGNDYYYNAENTNEWDAAKKFRYVMPESCPAPADKVEMNSKMSFKDTVVANQLKFGKVVRVTDIDTGKANKDGFIPNMATMESCEIWINGVTDEDGVAVGDLCDTRNVKPVTPDCSLPEIKLQTFEMRKALWQIKYSKISPSSENLLPILGSDSWGACSSLIDQALTFVDKPRTIETSMCTHDWDTDAWKSDPCCNWELSDTMCCAPREQTAMVPEAQVDTTALAAYCADDVRQLTTAVYAAKAFTESKKESTDQATGCGADREKKIEAYAPYRNVGKNCTDAVMGSWESNWKSSQECTTNDECYTGTCKAAASGEKTRYCQTSNDPTFLAKCLNDKLRGKPKARMKTMAFFANGNPRASPQLVGQGISQVAGRSMCLGADGWRYNPDWRECQIWDETTYECTKFWCEGEEDCMKKCEDSGQSCNTNPWEDWNEAKCEKDRLYNAAETDTTNGKFCGRCWGGVTTDETGKMIGSDCHEESRPSECRAHPDGNSIGVDGGWTEDSCQKYFGTTSNPNTNAYVREQDHEWDQNNFCELRAKSQEECNPEASCKAAGFAEKMACVVEDVPPQGCESITSGCDSTWCDGDNDDCCDWWENKWQSHWYNSKADVGGHKWVEICTLWRWRNGDYDDKTYLTEHCPAGSVAQKTDSVSDTCKNEGLMCYAPLSEVADETACNAVRENKNSDITLALGSDHWDIHFDTNQNRCRFQAHDWWGDLTAAQAYIDFCEDSMVSDGFTMHRGKHFHLGQFETEEKCDAGTCSFGSHLDAEECAKTAECSNWNCQGCRQNWMKADEKRDSGTEVPWSVCYKLGGDHFTETDCGDISDETEWTQVSGSSDPVCIISKENDQTNCVGDGYIWGNCENMEPDQCGGDGKSFPTDGIAEHLLVCEASGHAKCRDQESCEAAGRCDGGLHSSYHYKAEGDENEEEHYKPYVCVAPATIEHGWSHCHDYLPDDVVGYDTWQYGIEHLWASDECVLLKVEDQADCDAVSGPADSKGVGSTGVWTSTLMTESTCEVKKKCKRGDWDFSRLPEDECTKCGQSMEYVNTWFGNTWKFGTVEQNMVWLERSYDKKNTWGSEIDQWRFQEVMRGVIDSLSEEIHAEYVNCMYNGMMDSIEKIACVCGEGAKEGECNAIFGGMVSLVNTTAYADAAETAGREMATKIKMQKESIVVDEDAEEYTSDISASKQLFIPKTSEDTGTASLSKQVRRMLTRAMKGGVRRLEEEVDSGLNSAECMTVVENDNGFLVGQLLGDCVMFNTTAPINPQAPATLCVQTNSAIVINNNFTVKGFAEMDGDEKYLARPEVASIDGTTLCLDVYESVTVCPIARIPDYADATEDQGNGECGLVEMIVTEVVMKKKCTAGDSESCEWLQKGSLSYYAAIGGGIIAAISVAGCIVASCCGLWAHPKSRKVMKKHLNKAFFSSADADGDGMLDRGEVVAMFKKEFGENVTEGEVASLFQKYDVDGNGQLDFDEYKKMMKEHKVNVSQHSTNAVSEKGIQLLTIESTI
jgi:hypothetical protein